MTDFEAKKAILDIGKRMYDRGFVAANDGNISCMTGPRTVWTTPTGISKELFFTSIIWILEALIAERDFKT